MIKPRLDKLLERVDSHYAVVLVSAKRARQINSYFGQLGDGLGSNVPPQVTSVARKPLSIAFEEIAADKIEFVPVEPGEELVVVEGAIVGAEVLVEAAAAAAAALDEA